MAQKKGTSTAKKLPNKAALKFLESLTTVQGPSGFEEPVQTIWRQYLEPLADHIMQDSYGNTWAVLEAMKTTIQPKTILITGHSDEIGLMINHIEPSGLLRVVPIGGVDPSILPGRRVKIRGLKQDVDGVIGATAIHLQDRTKERKTPTMDQLFIDCGFTTQREAMAHVRVGLPITLVESFLRLGPTRAAARAFDNRIGIYTIAQVFERLKQQGKKLPFRLVALSTVQEEIGCVGAQFATRAIAPDLAFVVDVTHATDTPGIAQAKHGKVEMGHGPTITHGTANHPMLVEHLLTTAKKHKIAVQHEASSRFTGTDTDSIYKNLTGIPSALISLPNRYMHTPVEVIDLTDLEALVQLLTNTLIDVNQLLPKLVWQSVAAKTKQSKK